MSEPFGTWNMYVHHGLNRFQICDFDIALVDDSLEFVLRYLTHQFVLVFWLTILILWWCLVEVRVRHHPNACSFLIIWRPPPEKDRRSFIPIPPRALVGLVTCFHAVSPNVFPFVALRCFPTLPNHFQKLLLTFLFHTSSPSFRKPSMSSPFRNRTSRIQSPTSAKS